MTHAVRLVLKISPRRRCRRMFGKSFRVFRLVKVPIVLNWLIVPEIPDVISQTLPMS